MRCLKPSMGLRLFLKIAGLLCHLFCCFSNRWAISSLGGAHCFDKLNYSWNSEKTVYAKRAECGYKCLLSTGDV